MNIEERKQRWYETALNQEFETIKRLPADLNIHKGGNPFWISLIKIASLSKGGGITNAEALTRIKEACAHMELYDKQIYYQWNRAYQRAEPRHPDL